MLPNLPQHAVSEQVRKETEERVVKMEEEMHKAAAEERYEEAAGLRDQVEAMRKELAGNALTVCLCVCVLCVWGGDVCA